MLHAIILIHSRYSVTLKHIHWVWINYTKMSMCLVFFTNKTKINWKYYLAMVAKCEMKKNISCCWLVYIIIVTMLLIIACAQCK